MNLVSIFHNNIGSLNRNLENLVTHYLQELGIHFNEIGVTETKITNSNRFSDLAEVRAIFPRCEIDSITP